ncbi:MAG: hypothetical protein ACHQ0J_12075 [Candidatus Dormibacterales bacterium]
MELAAGLYLAGCAAAGFGLTYLSGVKLSLEERVVIGAVLGPMTVTTSSFALSVAVADVTLLTALAGLGSALVVATIACVLARAQLAADASEARRRWLAPLRSPGHPWPLAVVTVVCGAWTVHFFHQAYVYTPLGLYAGYVNIWGDWAAHLSFASSFAYGHNFPPEYSIDPGHRLGYPFMADFFAADLVPLGVPLTAALVATSGLLGLAFPGVLYVAAERFARGRAAASIAVFVFLLSGGLGFAYFIGDLWHGGLAVLTHLPREYTLDRDLNYQWLNPVLAYLVPQRSTLFGFSLVLIVLMLIWTALRDGARWRPFVFAGLIAGAMPAFHVHAYGTAVALSAFWALFARRRQWLGFFGPALVIGLPILVWLWPAANTSVCGTLPDVFGYCIEPGWLSFLDWSHSGGLAALWGIPWFWIKNTSVLLPLLVVAHLVRKWIPSDFARWFAPMWLWFVVPNVILLQPWDWDNTKFFVFWALLGSVMVGGLLAGMMKKGGVLAAVAAVMLLLLGFSGALDLTRASDYSVSANQFIDAGGLNVAAWVRQNTSPTSVFAVADQHNNPIPTLTGRREVIGYSGWLWTYGLPDYVQKGSDLKLILAGAPSAQQLVAEYGVDYVMIGPQEVQEGASRAYWDEHATLVYDDGEYAVYRTTLG